MNHLFLMQLTMKPTSRQALHSRSNSRSPCGFTLTELLVVILIVAVLSALAFLGLQKARDAADQSHCVASLRQLGTAGTAYAAERGYHPRNGTVSGGGNSWWFKEMEVALGFEAGTNPSVIDRAPSMPTCRKCLRDAGLLHNKTNYSLRTYSMNDGLHVPTRDEAGQLTFPGIRSPLFAQPSRTAFFMDGGRGAGMNYWDALARRNEWNIGENFIHNGRANAVFLDGHVDNFRLNEIPTNANHPFWNPTSTELNPK